jgi:hypothetical protein
MNFNQEEQINELIKTIRDKEIDVRPRPMWGMEKHLDRIVETLALSSLMANNPNKKVEKRLKEIAFPLEMFENDL